MAMKSNKLQQLRFSSNDVQYVIKLTLIDAELALRQTRRQIRMYNLQWHNFYYIFIYSLFIDLF